MHQILKEILDKLKRLESAIDDNTTHSAAFSEQTGNWAFPSLSELDLRDRVDELVKRIETFGADKIKSDDDLLSSYTTRIQFLIDNTVPNLESNPQQGIPALLWTLDGLERALKPNLTGDPNGEAVRRVKSLNSRLRSREAQLEDIAPRLEDLGEKIKRIENAHSAADQLPTDLQALKEARTSIAQIQTEVEANKKLVEEAANKIDAIALSLGKSQEEAQSVLARCETAYSAATSVGLAAAFSARSKALNSSVWFWTLGLVLALGIAGWLGFIRISELAKVIANPQMSDTRTALQFLLSALTIGAPIWFAWLATRQIGQRFRLAEDYAFKASVSQAYEGYRREAARIDADMEHQLLTTALARLDEQPLRLVEDETHSSPMNELVSSPAIQKALATVPNFAANVRDFAIQSIKKPADALPQDFAKNHDATEGIRVQPEE